MRVANFLLNCLASFFVATATAHAAPVVVDFEDVSLGTISSSSITSNGYTIAHTGSFASVSGNSGQGATAFSGNGTKRFIAFNKSSLTLSESSGSIFDIFSFEGGESWINQPHQWATQIRAVGTLFGGGTVTQIFDLDLIKDPITGMQVFSFDNTFRGLISVAFDGIGGNPEFSVDNLSVAVAATVPEPGSLALVGLTLVGLVLVRRKKA